MTVYNILLNRIRQLNAANNHLEVRTPLIWKSELYKTSGHLDHYSQNMFSIHEGNVAKLPDQEDNIYGWLKPMNCPGHMEVFRSKQWSYKDLPVGFAEYSPLHRNETSGAIGGLTRTRCFCQDDAHVFCSPETLQPEIKKIISMIDEVYSKWFDMKYRAVLSTRPKEFMGQARTWDAAEAALAHALNDYGMNGKVEIAEGDGAFYGPKIDFIVQDALGREWQTATIQLDFQLPEKFELEYTDADNHQKQPIVIHRAIFGSFERFIAILLESTGGKLPFWLAPVSVAVLPISDKAAEYSREIYEKLLAIGVRAELDNSNSTLSQKILVSHNKQIPYLAIVGNIEEKNRTVTVRYNLQQQEILPLDEFFPRMMNLNEL